ncbi:MAG: S41 family peptidase [Chitinophagaceae bacterium]
MRKLMICYSAFFIILAGKSASGSGGYTLTDTSVTSCVQKASRQLDEAFLLMEQHYYKKETVQWDTLKTAAKARLAAAGSCEGANETVDWCFRQISEKHSFIMPADKAAVYNLDTANRERKPSLFRLVGEIKGEVFANKGIAYLTLPWIGTADPAICTLIADSIQQLIARLDQPKISKWIVDLRKNTGGNCWPMLAGIGPLLGNGICGYFVSDTEKIPISYNNGAALQGRSIRCKITGNAYQTRIENKWIIVLTGPLTSSAGEIVALSFKGKKQTWLYGEATAGLTTANATYTLSDRSVLVLTVCQEADRYGRVQEGKIIPDKVVSSEAIFDFEDPVKQEAMMLLHIL